MEIFNSAKTISMAIFFRLVLGISLTLGCIFFAKLSFATELQPYDLHYTANLGGMKIEARHQLKQNSGKYSIETQAKNFLGTISEKGSFKISDSGQIVPLRYSRKQNPWSEIARKPMYLTGPLIHFYIHLKIPRHNSIIARSVR